MVTPLKDSSSLDIPGLERLVEHLIQGGVHGLFILGTTGEAQSLGYSIRRELIERVCELVKQRIPVLVGITDAAPDESIRLAKSAAENGADAVVAAPPYYFTPSENELRHYYLSLADRVPLPLMLYNMPSHTKINLDAGLIQALGAHDNVVGIKDSSGDLIYFQKVIKMMNDKPDFSLLIGPEELLMQALLSGCHGGVSGGANMFPELYVGMYNAFLEKDLDKMERLQKHIIQVSSSIYAADTYGGGYLQGLKGAMSVMDICSAALASPLLSIQNEQMDSVQKALLNLESIGVYKKAESLNL